MTVQISKATGHVVIILIQVVVEVYDTNSTQPAHNSTQPITAPGRPITAPGRPITAPGRPITAYSNNYCINITIEIVEKI